MSWLAGLHEGLCSIASNINRVSNNKKKREQLVIEAMTSTNTLSTSVLRLVRLILFIDAPLLELPHEKLRSFFVVTFFFGAE